MNDVARLSLILWYVMALMITTMTATIIFEMHFQRQLRRSLWALLSNPAVTTDFISIEVEKLRKTAFWFRMKFYLVWILFLSLSAAVFSV